MIHDLVAGARFVARLPGFLRSPLDPGTAADNVRVRRARGAADFLALVRRGIYGNPAHPLRALLVRAGCEYGDLAALVAAEGTTATLRTLLKSGVYITGDELKGRRPMVRGGASIAVNPGRFRNPWSRGLVPSGSGGRSGASTPAAVDLAFVRATALDFQAVLAARGGLEWRHAVWGVPGSAAMIQVLRYAICGAAPVRWFSQIEPAAPGLHARYRWSVRAMLAGAFVARRPLPRPRHVPLDDPRPIVDWMRDELKAGNTPHLHGFASSAVRLSEAAGAAGIELAGAQLTVSGEPWTEARQRAVRASGLMPFPSYGNSELGGTVAHGCLVPASVGDLHVFDDLRAVIQGGGEAESQGLPADALLVTSVHRAAPLVVINYAPGDAARLVERDCGCPLASVGWRTHLEHLRSYEKLTAGGMTFWDFDLVRVLEEELPAQFGGGPTDYQVVEEENADGRPGLVLVVHPRLGPLDPAAVVEAFLRAIGAGRGAERIMSHTWRQAGLARVERRPPEMSTTGKIVHLR